MEKEEVMARVSAMRTAGLSIEEIAKKIGINWRTVMRWERGETVPKSPLVIKALRRVSKSHYTE